MSETYKVTYQLDNERYSVYLNADSQQDAIKETKARESTVVVINVEKAGKSVSER